MSTSVKKKDTFVWVTPEKSVNDWLNMAAKHLANNDPLRVVSDCEIAAHYPPYTSGLSAATRKRLGHARFTLHVPAMIWLIKDRLASQAKFRARLVSDGKEATEYPTAWETHQLEQVADYENEIIEWEAAGRPEVFVN